MNKKVLIVEDEFIVANDLRLILTTAGYTITGIAESKEKAEISLQQDKPDLVIIDIRLKGKPTGIDFARTLKAEDIAFIYLSANSNQKILEEAKTTDPYGFIVKPFRERDLLVTLDIAWYRHTHSLESKLRQEKHLLKQLSEISAEVTDAQQKMMKLTGALQPYLPFDFISVGIRPINAEQLSDKGYLRVGFDEYQFIGEKELLTITGLGKSDLALTINNTLSHTNAIIHSNEPTGKVASSISLQCTIMHNFALQTYLVFPISMGYGLSVHYFFYNRKAGVYTSEHIQLLNRLKIYLEELAEQIVQDETSPSILPISKTANKRIGDTKFNNIIGNHHLLLSALDLATQVAPYNTSVLILGETGTGKEKIAQCIHALSTRKKAPFIKVNCAAIPEALVESELFGHEKGAFTGAIEKRKGKFEQADGGTIFLDEIGELPLSIQVKLLRVLQEKEIEYVGGTSPVKIDVRIVAATNRNLEKEIALRNFRMDLYFRLNVFPITMPALRERKTDIEALVLFFATKFCSAFNKPFNGIGDPMLQTMQAYDWPGNIRELENVVEQSVVLSDGKSPLQLMRNLTATDYEPDGSSKVNTLGDLKLIQQNNEKEHIKSILKKTKGRIRGADGAAEILKIKPTTLEAKMLRFNINRQDFMNAS